MLKSLFTILFIILIQIVVTAQIIPNHSFESWIAGNPVNWLTSNFPGFDMVTQDANAFDGNFSAHMEVLGNSTASYIPVLQVIDADSMDGIPISQRYTLFSGNYIFNRMGIDFFNVQIFMYSNNVLIGTGELPLNPENNWTEFNVEINYFNSDIPDRVAIWLSISALGGGQGTVGSNGNIDNVMLGYINEVEKINGVPENYVLRQNYPNPFNPQTNIEYSIPVESLVKLNIYDVLGTEVAELVNEKQPAGIYRTDFVAKKLSSGFYFYRIQAGSFVETKKMVLMK